MLLRHTTSEVAERAGIDGQPGQDLPADRRDVRGLGHPQLPAAQPRLAGLLLVSPQHAHAALQGARDGRHQFLHGRLLGVRRPGQSAPGHLHDLHRLQPRRDRRPHDVPLGDDRRRHPADPGQGPRRREDPRRQARDSRQHAELRRLARDGLRQHGQGHGHLLCRAGREADEDDQRHPRLGRAQRHARDQAAGGRDGHRRDPLPRHVRRARCPADRRTRLLSQGRRDDRAAAEDVGQPGDGGPGPDRARSRPPRNSTPSSTFPTRAWNCRSACGRPTASSTRCASWPTCRFPIRSRPSAAG